MPFGAELRPGGAVRFRLWAPAAERVGLALRHDAEPLPMRREAGGWHELETAARPGDAYRFVLPDGRRVADPASRAQADDCDGPSLVVDPDAYRWRHPDWPGRPWREAVIYELHVGTFTPEGTFAGAAQHLPHLAATGITAVELMPVADFPGGRNWGYDGVLPFAPDRRYGTPADLKALVDAAHGLGLMMILDVVDNHFGPEGNYLAHYAPTFFTADRHTPWGAAIDFSQRAVRDFYLHNALYWLEEYRLDGLRFDAVHAILDPSETEILVEIARAVRTRFAREIHLIVENERNRAALLRPDPVFGRTLYDAQWNDDFHHACHALITGESAGYYADFADRPAELLRRSLTEGFAYQGEPSPHQGGAPRGEPSADLPPVAFVDFLQNHDQIGNRALGERLTTLVPAAAARACQALLLLSPQPPMLFMGEEWGAETPFCYFCDYSGELGQSIRDGRRREFEAFHAAAEIPDPLAPETYAASKLDWADLDQPDHAAWLATTRTLLDLRARELVPRLIGEVAVLRSAVVGSHGLEVVWQLGDGGELALRANLGPQPTSFGRSPAGRLLYATSAEPAEPAPPWSVAWTLSPDH